QDIDDVLSIPTGSYNGGDGGKLVYNGTKWIYTPAPGFEGKETFTIDVWDGQNAYGSHIEGGIQGPVYGKGTVTVTVTSTPPPPPTPTPTPVIELAPVAPLADYEIPRLVGCPVEMEAAATELAVNSDELQLLIANAMATNPNLQPCDACANLLTAAATLQDPDGSRMAALEQIFADPRVAQSLTGAALDQPFTPETATNLEMAMAEILDENPQLAAGMEYADAFAEYVAVINEELRVPVGDPVALVLERHGGAIADSENEAVTAYITSLLVEPGSL
ncbi:MAG: Ig-like domain-containing protein, partial [Planctomycetota bacterium]